MKKARYRIEDITIEGFRGFTTPQTITCGAKNVFVFGPNGRGKSSVIEAIRWCLFGSPTGKQEIEVRNTFYEKGDCIVTMTLTSADGSLQLRRQLRPGVDKSRASISSAEGKGLPLHTALPELARIGHEQGTQVIFAAQQAVGRQATVDIADFTQVLCFYLKLEDAPELVKQLRRTLEERTKEADRLALDLTSAEHRYRESIKEFQTRLNVLLANSPWGEGPAPTGEETHARIVEVLVEQARLYGVDVPQLNGKPALDEIRRLIDASDATTLDAKHQRLIAMENQLQEARKLMVDLKKAKTSAASTRADYELSQSQLTELMAGGTADELRAEALHVERSMSARQKRVQIARLARTLSDEITMAACPLCDTELEESVLNSRIATHLQEAGEAAKEGQTLSSLQSRLHKIDLLAQAIVLQLQLLSVAQTNESGVRTALQKALGLSNMPAESTDAEQAIDTLAADVESLKREIAASATERQRKSKNVKNLEAELSYHEYRDYVDVAQRSLGAGLDPVRSVLAEYRELLQAISEITNLVDAEFNHALDRISPELNSLLTEVYARLTKQVSYDEIRISRNSEPPYRRQLRVASSRLQGQTFPPNVLNGQAAKALQLVPYFVFSRFQPEIMELDLLLIDDPSESFDTSHVESLVSELSEAAKHAQIIVATHEREKFEPHLEHMFSCEPFKVVSVERFEPMGGPTIDGR